MTTQWETVHIFISSTFNDMHAERDYLVKQVFPQLREWCERRKLRLVDIDLRWGVTEADAQNQSVVKVCLDRIDDCRPFFLCFLGQRRGWVPGEADISPATFTNFPGLQEYAGKASVTEMEILHALVNPLHRGLVHDPQKPGEFYEPVRHAFFYLREDTYLNQLPTSPAQVRQTYTNEGIEDPNERALHDAQLKVWRAEKIPATGRPFKKYNAGWDPTLATPELQLPLKCPSASEKAIRNWQNQWRKAGVHVSSLDIEEDPSLSVAARTFNTQLGSGRLAHFLVENQPLSQVILADLQSAIASRFPEHREVVGETDLQKEVDQQEQFLFAGSEGFIERRGDFDELDAYVEGESDQLFVLTAAGGMGKSSLLAKWLSRYRIKTGGRDRQTIHFRFIGQSDRSTTVYSLLYFLLQEIKETTGKLDEQIPDDPRKLQKELRELLEAIGKHGRTIIVLDALNQLESGLADLSWLPYQLPENIKLIISFKRGEEVAETLLQHMQDQIILSEVRPFETLEHRRQLVNKYLDQYLKQLDEKLLEALITLPGAENPLYLKVVLSELRIFGAFANLEEKIRSDFGETPPTAFAAVLRRLENDPAYSQLDPKVAVPLIFGLLAHARQGLSVDELDALIVQVLGVDHQAARDTIHLYLRQVRPFLAHRDGRYDFFFESFRLAAQARYATEEHPGTQWHQRLAAYFNRLTTWESGGAQGTSRPTFRKVSELAFHQAHGGLLPELVDTLTDFDFLDAALHAFGPHPVIGNYAYTSKFQPASPADQACLESLALIRDALSLSAHTLSEDANQLAGQLVGRLSAFETPEIRGLVQKAQAWNAAPWLCPLTASLMPPGSALLRTLSGHTKEINALAATPDGRRIVTAADDGKLRVWDSNHQWDSYILDAHSPGAWAVAITPDGQKAISGGSDGSLKLWDLEHRTEIGTLPGHALQVHGVAISADGQRALSVSWDKTLKVWDLYWMSETATLFTAPSLLSVVAITPDGHLGVSETGNDLLVWDLDALERKGMLKGHSGSIDSLAVTPDGHYAVSGSEDKTIRIWDLNSMQPYAVLEGVGDEIHSVAMTPDARTVFSGCEDHTIRAWDVPSGKTTRKIDAHSNAISGLAVTADGRTLFSASRDKTIRIWDLERTSQGPALKRYPSGINVVTITPDGKGAVGSFDGTVSLWDIKMGLLEREQSLHPSGIAALAGEAEGGKLVVALGDGKIIQWTGQGQDDTLADGILGCRTIVIVGRRILLGTTRGIELVWLDGRDTPDVLAQIPGPLGVSWGVSATAISDDGHRAVMSVSDGSNTLYVIEPIKVKLLPDFPGVGMFSALALTADGKQAIGAASNCLRIFDLEKQVEIGKLPGHKSAVEWLSLTPDGHFLASAHNDGILQLWDLHSMSLLATFQDDARLLACALSPDGSQLVAGGLSGAVHIFNLKGFTTAPQPQPAAARFSLFGHSKER